MPSIIAQPKRAGLAQFRTALFASVAVAALCIAAAPPALAECTGTTEVVCTGNQSGGVHYSGPRKLTVRDLSTDITPPAGSGISLLNASGTAVIDANVSPYAIITQGVNAPGIVAWAPDDVTVDSIGRIVTWGIRSPAILAYSIDGKSTVHNEADLATDVSNSNGITAIGPAGAEVINSGDIEVRGPNSDAIHAKTFNRASIRGGKVSVVNDGALSNLGVAGGDGIDVESAGDAEVTNRGPISVAGSRRAGISVDSNGPATIHNDGRIVMTGQSSVGIRVDSRSSVDLDNSADITASPGAYSYGILVSPGAAAAIHNSGDVATTGPSSTGIKVYGPDAIALYNSGKVITEGDASHGLSALSDTAEVLISSTADITTSGAGSDGIRAQGKTRAEVDAGGGTISTAGAGSAGIYAQSDGDVVVVSAADITTHGDDADAILVHNGLLQGSGEVSVTSERNLRTEGAGSIGIDVIGTGSLLDLATKGRVDTFGEDATGIQLWAVYGDARLRNEAAITTAGNGAAGIYAQVDAGSLELKNFANVTTSGDNAPGIVANVAGALTFYSSADIETEGSGSPGIRALISSPADPDIATKGTITTHGNGADGMLITAVNGHTTLNSSADITNLGDNSSGLRLIGHGAGQARINSEGRLTSRGLNNRGIDARAYDRFALDVHADGDIDVEGSNAAGVWLYSFGSGNVSLASRGRVVVSGGAPTGLSASSLSGDAAVQNAGPVSIVGSYGRGMAATGVNAQIINQGDLAITGDFSTGILAMATMKGAAPGTALIENAGDVTVAGTNSSGLYAASSFGAARVIVGSGTTVTGGSGNGFGVGLNGTSEALLENHGTIQSLNDEAIFNGAGSGPLTIANLGTVNGFVLLNDGEDDLTNLGQFTARGDSDFGAGLDSFVNDGTLRLAESGGADHVAFLGLETFTNGPTGVITMVNGRTGDRLSFPSLTAFHGGGVIALDAELAGTGAPADLLTVSGVVSGKTLLRVNNTSKGEGVRGADNIFVIDQGSAPSGNEFALENGPIPVGFLYYDLRPDDDGSTFWELYQSGPNQRKIDQFPVLMTGLQNLWHAGVSAWHQRMGDLVTLAAMPGLEPAADLPGAPPAPRMQGGVWLRGFGEQARYDTTSRVDFHQDIEGFQIGLDGVTAGPLGGDSLIAGLLGGFARSDLDFDGSPDSASYEGDALGAYLTYLNGGFHADLLVKGDLVTVTFDQAALTTDFDATAIGGSFELGYKFDLGSGLFANPLGQLAYVSTNIDDGWIGSAPVAFDDGDSLRSRAGLRIGVLELVGSFAVEPYVEAYLMHEFLGDNHAWVYDYPGAPAGVESWGMAGGGIQVMAANLTAFANFQAFIGNEIGGVAGQGGLRWNF